jgi:hypothetical protein
MSSPMRNAQVDITAGPRAVIGATAGLLYRVGCSVLGQSRVPTAQANAWAAVCVDRKRAQERAELERWLTSGRQRRAPSTP